MKKALILLLSLLLLLPAAGQAEDAYGGTPDEDEVYWVEYDYTELTVGNVTPMQGKFFTGLWGGSTSDMDVQELLHGYNLVKWDNALGRFRFDRSVVSGALVADDGENNRTYHLILQEDLTYSDDTPITAWDYAFSLLLSIDPVIGGLGGTAADASWLVGGEEYVRGKSDTLSGLRVVDDHHLSITVKAAALPYFYELARLSLKPYPIGKIAPGLAVRDDGAGAQLTNALTVEQLRDTIMDPEHGYLAHPRVVSGPYCLTSFDGVTAAFRANDAYKGNEAGQTPRIRTLYYTLADNRDMIAQLGDGEFALLNKATLSRSLLEGIKLAETQGHQYTMSSYPRTGLTLLWFVESSPIAQQEAVRRAFAYCLDREALVRDYVGPFGLAVDGYFGLGQWMYQAVTGGVAYDPPLPDNPSLQETQAYEEAVAAWDQLSLDGVTRYGLDVNAAVSLLEEDGWTLNEAGQPYDPAVDTVRYKQIDGRLVGLTLVLAIPQSMEAAQEIEQHFLPTLRQAGFDMAIRMVDMPTLQSAYMGAEDTGVDLIYLGENFSIVFDPEVFRPHGEGQLAQAHGELYALAQDMVRTDPNDPLSFMRKWVALQERISQLLPLIPVYSNVYFDFYTRELYNYDIADAVTWAEAIVPAYLSDPEYYSSEVNDAIEEELEEMGQMFIQ